MGNLLTELQYRLSIAMDFLSEMSEDRKFMTVGDYSYNGGIGRVYTYAWNDFNTNWELVSTLDAYPGETDFGSSFSMFGDGRTL